MLSPAYCDNKAGVTDNTVPVGSLRRPRGFEGVSDTPRPEGGPGFLSVRGTRGQNHLAFGGGLRRRLDFDDDSHRVRTMPRNPDFRRTALSLSHTVTLLRPCFGTMGRKP